MPFRQSSGKELSCSYAGRAVLPEKQFAAHLVSLDTGSESLDADGSFRFGHVRTAHATDSVSRSLCEITAETPSPRIVTP